MLTEIVDSQIPMSLLRKAGVPSLVQRFLARLLVKEQGQRPTADMLVSSEHEAEVAVEGNAFTTLQISQGFGVAGFLKLEDEDGEGVAVEDCDEEQHGGDPPCRVVLFSTPRASQLAVAKCLQQFHARSPSSQPSEVGT
mmetsp:Transcript_30155/g.69001  ORF Transcript_30155/g.69001 Transcript_30155/m.69001 type:complete len:139 (-) Transcript_30155:42-458(-)